MKNILIFILCFLPFLINGQNHPTPIHIDTLIPVQVIQVKGITDVDINTQGDLVVNYTDGTSEIPGHVVGSQGPTGNQGPQGIQGVKGDQGIQGIQGIQGPPGTGSLSAFVTPEQYGANHQVNSTVDADAIQQAVNNSNGKMLLLYGTYYLNHGISVPITQNLIQKGQAILYTNNNNAFDVWSRPQPVDLNQAIQMQNYKCTFENLTISMQSNQTGFNMRPGSNNEFHNIIFVGGNWAARSEFQLNANYSMCTVLGCTNGIYIGIGSFPGANINNSQSNCSRVSQYHCHTVSNIGLYIDASYEVAMDMIIIEGNGSINYGVYYNMQTSTTSKNGKLDFLHGEQTGGASGAWVYANLRDGSLQLGNIITHYSGLVVEGTSATGAATLVVEYLNYAVGDANGKYFKSSNIDYQFNWCSSFYPSVVPNLFTSGSNITYCSGNVGGCPSNSFGVLTR